MNAEILKHTGKLTTGKSIKEMIENAKLSDDEFILFFDERLGKYRVFDNQTLVDICLKESGLL